MKKKRKNTPFFVFNVTMQNHSSYTDDFDNFHPEIIVDNSNSKALNNYLSLIKISDEAIEGLVNYFSFADEDTMIIFFGDHQPTNSVVSNIWKLNGKNGSNLSMKDEAKRYKSTLLYMGKLWHCFPITYRNKRELPKRKAIRSLRASAIWLYCIPIKTIRKISYTHFPARRKRKGWEHRSQNDYGRIKQLCNCTIPPPVSKTLNGLSHLDLT